MFDLLHLSQGLCQHIFQLILTAINDTLSVLESQLNGM